MSSSADEFETQIEQLSSEDRETRDGAYSSLVELVELEPKRLIPLLRDRMLSSGEPEIRLRCQSLLKEIYLEQHIPKRLGFLGISQGPRKVEFEGKLFHAVGIAHVQVDSAADLAGLLAGDDILYFNDTDFNEIDIRELIYEFRMLVESAGMGSKIKLGVLRGGKLHNLEATLGLSSKDTRDFTDIEKRFPQWLESLDPK